MLRKAVVNMSRALQTGIDYLMEQTIEELVELAAELERVAKEAKHNRGK